MEKYFDAKADIQDRVADLLERMTLEEKLGQLKSNDCGKPLYYIQGEEIVFTEYAKKILSGNVFGFFILSTRMSMATGLGVEVTPTPTMCAQIINKFQKYALEHSRLRIPVLFGNPATHGHLSTGSTIFPTNLMIGSTWNPELFSQVCSAIAKESRAQGSYMSDPAIIDTVVDPRWGRTEENFGEDPYLAGEMAVAAVKGLQNDNQFGPDAVVSLLKHFVAHGASVGGHNCAPSVLPEREFIERYLRSWKKAVDAGALAIMPSYNEVDGIPNHINKKLLTDIVKNDWGFKGYVMADERAIVKLHTIDKVAENHAKAQVMAFNAGVDIDVVRDVEAYIDLLDAYHQDKITMERIDDAVSRILYGKFKIGLFDQPYTDETKAEQVVACAAHKQLARKAVQQGVVMLENKNNALPLRKKNLAITITGPNADSILNQMGDYTPNQNDGDVVTVLKGMQQQCDEYGITVKHVQGSYIHKRSDELLAEAVQAAQASDVVIAVVGGSSWKNEIPGVGREADCGEGFDLANLDISDPQDELLKALKQTGKKLIVVLINGRPMSINWIKENCDAVLEAWYPGWEGGHGVADILFGNCCPSGKLTISFPRHVGQLPVYYNRKNDTQKDYVGMTYKPLYPFGYGLSYTTFEYSNLQLKQQQIKMGERAQVCVDVSNTGRWDADEIVQLYIHDDYASTTRPCKELKDFKRVSLKAGETKTVSFLITMDKLTLVNQEMEEVVEPGTFTIMAGGNSEQLLESKLSVI